MRAVIFVTLLAVAVALAAPGAYEHYEEHQEHHQEHHHEHPLVHKEFYYVKAEDKDFKEETQHFVVGKPKKDYRVVFIKAPSTQPKVKYHLKQAPQEEKTNIYVFSKKGQHLGHDDFTLSGENVRHKPDVHFFKYSKEQEAESAKKHISQHYEKLGGSSDHKSETVSHVQLVEGYDHESHPVESHHEVHHHQYHH